MGRGSPDWPGSRRLVRRGFVRVFRGLFPSWPLWENPQNGSFNQFSSAERTGKGRPRRRFLRCSRPRASVRALHVAAPRVRHGARAPSRIATSRPPRSRRALARRPVSAPGDPGADVLRGADGRGVRALPAGARPRRGRRGRDRRAARRDERPRARGRRSSRTSRPTTSTSSGRRSRTSRARRPASSERASRRSSGRRAPRKGRARSSTRRRAASGRASSRSLRRRTRAFSPLPGAHQRQNVSLAVAAARARRAARRRGGRARPRGRALAGPARGSSARARGRSSSTAPTTRREPRALAAHLDASGLSGPVDLLFGGMADKDLPGVFAPLAARARRIVLVAPDSPRAETPERCARGSGGRISRPRRPSPRASRGSRRRAATARFSSRDRSISSARCCG